MNKTVNFMIKYGLPICIAIIFIAGVLQLAFGSVTIGLIQVFTGFYVITLLTPMKMETMVKRYAIWVGTLTVGMIGCAITLICIGEYFGAFSSSIIIVAGIMNIYIFYFKKGKEEKKNA